MMLKNVYQKALVVSSGEHLTTVNEFTDQIPALRPRVLWEAALEVVKCGNFSVNKIVTEEDKGAPIATAVSLVTGVPLAMARWYNYDLSKVSPVRVNISSEYFSGELYLNGIEAGDRVTIVDDTLSTGGAVVALVNAVRRANAEVVDIICVIEKEGKKGKERVYRETGIHVKTIQKIMVSTNGVKVLDTCTI